MKHGFRIPGAAMALLATAVVVALALALPAVMPEVSICRADGVVSVSGFSPTRGHAFTSLSISGQGFNEATSITVGGLEVEVFTVVDDAHATALVPPGAVTGPVGITSPQGSAASSCEFTVIPGCDPTSGFAARDALPQSDVPEDEWYQPENWNNAWGPWPSDYPDVPAPEGCAAGRWRRSRIIASAMKYAGLSYRHHHIPAWDPPEDPGAGLDCSNFTSWVYNYGLGVKFTSNVQEQADGPDAPGEVVPSGQGYLPGDLLFITDSEGTEICHVAIYLDEGHVIDSTSTEGGVGVRSFSGWYVNRLDHARRVVPLEPDPSVQTSVAGGAGTVNPSSQAVEYGVDAIPLVITPGAGQEIDRIMDNGSLVSVTDPSGMTYEITALTGDHLVEVVFGYSTPVVLSVSPAAGVNSGVVDITDLAGANFREGARVRLVRAGKPAIEATDVKVLSGKRITCGFDLDGAPPGRFKIRVTNTDGKSGEKDGAFAVRQAPEPFLEAHTWYLAEGSSDYGFDTYVTIQNPNPEVVTADVTYMTATGPATRPPIPLPACSQTVINPRDDLGAADFSTRVKCREGKTICVDRRMTWTGPGARAQEGHASVGVRSPSRTWYLPEGSSKWGFESWLLVQNPNPEEARLTITYMIEGRGPVRRSKTVDAYSRCSFNMETDIGGADASIKLESTNPVIPERAMYRDNRRQGHCSIGTTTPAMDYYLAEGSTNWGFATYILVMNPNSRAARVKITYMTPQGPVSQDPFTMAANSRKTVAVNSIEGVEATDCSAHVAGSRPIIAERAMYWGAHSALGEACHDSIGMDSPRTTFFLPDGELQGMETWTLVQNPNGTEIAVEIAYFTTDGAGNVVFTETIPARSRKSFYMADRLPGGRAAIMVTCRTPGKKIMCERAMYWDNRGAGTDTIGWGRD